MRLGSRVFVGSFHVLGHHDRGGIVALVSMTGGAGSAVEAVWSNERERTCVQGVKAGESFIYLLRREIYKPFSERHCAV